MVLRVPSRLHFLPKCVRYPEFAFEISCFRSGVYETRQSREESHPKTACSGAQIRRAGPSSSRQSCSTKALSRHPTLLQSNLEFSRAHGSNRRKRSLLQGRGRAFQATRGAKLFVEARRLRPELFALALESRVRVTPRRP